MSDVDPAVLCAVAGGIRGLRSRIVAAVRREAPSARLITARETADDLEYLLSLLLRCVNAGAVNTSPADNHRLATIGAGWADRRVPPAELVIIHRVPMRVIIERVREAGARLGRRPAQLLGTVHRLLDICNALAGAVAEGYHHADDRRRHADLVRTLLFGRPDSGELVERARCHGLDPAGRYLAFRARATEGRTVDALAAAYRPARGWCAVAGTDLVGFGTAPPPASLPGVCGVGPARPLAELAESFRMATRALETVGRRGLAGVHEFARLGLLPAICADGAVSETLWRRYLAPLGHTESAAEIADTLHGYLMEGMSVARTAQRLFVHPNTVRYRIGRFEELAGVSLRDDAVVIFELIWALEHRTLPRRAAGRLPWWPLADRP